MKDLPITMEPDGWMGKTGGYAKDMTLRDYFAAKAMQGLLSNPKLANTILENGGAAGSWIQDSAYGWADAMLEAGK